MRVSSRARTAVRGLMFVGCVAVAASCGGKSSGDGADGGGNGADARTNDGGAGGADARVNFVDAAVCAQSTAEATLVNKPVDIIFVIDNSGSMTAEISEVEKQINANFATIIDAAVPAIDYRVIMLARHGTAASSQSVCISAPLGGIPDVDADGHCDTVPAQPVNTAKFFHHSVEIGSHNGMCQLLNNFATADEFNLQPTGYGAVLRPEAFKFIVMVTDDGVSCSFGGTTYNDGNSVAGGQAVATAFDTALLTLSPEQFGTALERNYSWWSIVAMAPFNPTGGNPYGDPHPPDEIMSPVTTVECTPSAVDPGTGYQGLSIITGGYRFPTCGLDYTGMFQLMAQGVIEGAQVACEFAIPDPPPGETLDLSTVQVRYDSNGTPVETFNQSTSLATCSTTENQFYIEDNLIKLCPTACGVVQNDENAEIGILFGCAVIIDG